MRSIMQKKDGTCYLCRKLYGDISQKQVFEHHVFFGNTSGRRALSEKYGLKVYLCLYHHTEGKEAVHKNKELCRMIQAEGQQIFERTFPDKDFLKIFGMNYK